jgi:hypothetical protein
MQFSMASPLSSVPFSVAATTENKSDIVRLIPRIALVLVFAALVIARNPNVFILGRFWAEEGSIYFIAAWENGPAWLPAITVVHTGYLNLAASLPATIAAHWVPLEDAPFVTSAFGLAAQLLPPSILLSSGDREWGNRPVVLAAALLLILVPPLKQEVWLNSITSQFHLALACALALALPPGRGRLSATLRGFVLAVGPLSGPVCVFLAPLFGLRALLAGCRRRWFEFVLIGAASLVQVAVMAVHREPGRDFGTGPAILSYAFLDQFLVLPFLGVSVAMKISTGLLDVWRSGQISWLTVFIAPVCAAMLVAVAFRVRRRDEVPLWLAASGLWLALLSYVGALTLGEPELLILVGCGTRYAYAPQVLLSLTLLRIATTASANARWPAMILSAWLFIVGVTEYRFPDEATMTGPSWASQVELWRHDPMVKLQLWPPWFWTYLVPHEWIHQ